MKEELGVLVGLLVVVIRVIYGFMEMAAEVKGHQKETEGRKGRGGKL
jgi:hypothetical protein